MDDTLLGDDDALARLAEALNHHHGVRLVLNSSRPLQSVVRSLDDLPFRLGPDGMVGALGTEVEMGGEPFGHWQARFAGWDRAPVDRAMARLGCPAHPHEYQTHFKASFSVDAARRREAEEAVAATGLAARVVYSGESSFDVIPANAGKEAPLDFLAEHFRVPADQVVAAGDSANDAGLLRAVPHAILVGNATAELIEALDADRATGPTSGGDRGAGSSTDPGPKAGPTGSPTHRYRAAAPHAGGIIEGLVELGILGLRAS